MSIFEKACNLIKHIDLGENRSTPIRVLRTERYCNASEYHGIGISEQMLQMEIERGIWWEYPSVRDIWRSTGYWKTRKLIPNCRPGKDSSYGSIDFQGDKVIWATILHEYAHTMTKERGHKSGFQRALYYLINKYPYSPELFELPKPKSAPKADWQIFLGL